MPTFRLRSSLAENIAALREALGSAKRALSRDDLAEMIRDVDASLDVTGSGIRWWEQRRGEPGVRVIQVMAQLAGVPFERFALGADAASATAYDEPELPNGAQFERGQKASRGQRLGEREDAS